VALAPFRVRNFRFQWPSDLLTSWAFEMETLILGWYVLVETRSVLWLTVFGALQFVGTLFSPLLGMLGDRLGHRNVLCCMRASYAVLATILMAIAFAGALTPMVVLAIWALQGLVRPSDLAVRQTLVAETMPPEQLMGGMGLTRTTSDLSRIGGALAGAELFQVFGIGHAYIMIVACYLAGLLFTCLIRPPAARTAVAAGAQPLPMPASPWRELKEGLVYVWSRPHMLAAMWLAFLVNLTAFPLSGGLLPYVAREVYQMGPTGLGLLVASFATGAFAGSIWLTVMGGNFRPGRMSLLFAVVWYAMLMAFAQMPSAGPGCAFLVVAGFAQSMSMVPLAVMLLRTSDTQFRGRVMGVRMLAIYSLPIGLLVAGALIERIGFHGTATVYAGIGLLLTVAIALKWRNAIWNTQAAGNVR
jgi:MFS family permease